MYVHTKSAFRGMFYYNLNKKSNQYKGYFLALNIARFNKK